MNEAIEEAYKAYALNEVPIGAVVVLNDKIIGRGFNTREASGDISAHAEINALKDAANAIGSWKLDGCEIYVTVKPCLMCYSAIEQSRVNKIVYGVDQYSYKKKAFDRLISDQQVQIIGPIDEERCQQLMTSFFERMRNGNNKTRT